MWPAAARGEASIRLSSQRTDVAATGSQVAIFSERRCSDSSIPPKGHRKCATSVSSLLLHSNEYELRFCNSGESEPNLLSYVPFRGH